MTADSHLQHVNVNVDDLASAIVFYHEVLGLALDPTPDQGFESQFFQINATQQIHMNVIADAHPFRAHFCIEVPDFVGVFQRANAAGAIDLEPWGKVRQLPNGKMQMFVRDPFGNLIEISSPVDAELDPALFEHDLVESQAGIFRMEPGTSSGGHAPV